MSLNDHLAWIATEALFAKWDHGCDGSRGRQSEELRRCLTEVLRRQKVIGESETAEHYEAQQLVLFHILACAAADPRKTKIPRDPVSKAFRARIKGLQKAQADLQEMLAEDDADPPHFRVLAFMPSGMRANLSQSLRELSGAMSFRLKLTGAANSNSRPPHPSWYLLITGLDRIYARLGGQPTERAFLAGLRAMNAALPTYAQVTDGALRKRVERVRTKSMDKTA